MPVRIKLTRSNAKPISVGRKTFLVSIGVISLISNIILGIFTFITRTLFKNNHFLVQIIG
jgi:hypothetical protein